MASAVAEAAPAGRNVLSPNRPSSWRRVSDQGAGAGRHRAGRPGLIPVTALVTVVRRGFLAALFRPGRHRAAGR